MSNGDPDWSPHRLRTMLPPWVLLLGGTAASLMTAGGVGDLGLGVALIGFVLLLLRLRREPDG